MNVTAVPADTPLEVGHVQMEIFRRMAPEKRLRLALDMCDSLRAIVASGVRYRHPEYSDEQVKLAAIRICLGERLFWKVYPEANLSR